jgi:hypothetical protein
LTQVAKSFAGNEFGVIGRIRQLIVAAVVSQKQISDRNFYRQQKSR